MGGCEGGGGSQVGPFNGDSSSRSSQNRRGGAVCGVQCAVCGVWCFLDFRACVSQVFVSILTAAVWWEKGGCSQQEGASA